MYKALIFLLIGAQLFASKPVIKTWSTDPQHTQKKVIGFISAVKIKKSCSSNYTAIYAHHHRPFFEIKKTVYDDGSYVIRFKTKQGETPSDVVRAQLKCAVQQAYENFKPFADKVERNCHVYWKYYDDGQIELDETSIKIRQYKKKAKL